MASTVTPLRLPALLRYVLLATLLTVVTACSGGANDDKVRIGSGQNGNSGTTGSVDFPIFYVKRVTPDFTDADTDDDVRRLRLFSTNADLYLRERASPSATERNITARMHPANERWDIKDLDVSADGGKVIFAMRGPLDDDQEDDEPPTWNIWEYTLASDTLRRVISSNVIAEEGQDVSPHYLPDGHILFASTRQYQSKAVLIDENKQQFEAQDENRNESSFVLHVMDSNGGNIQQISFNQSHDMDATVLSDGRVLFSRWDHAPGRTGDNRGGVHFYTTNPDGTNTQLLYGSASHATIPDTDSNGTITYPTVQFTKAREMRDGRILTLIRPFSDTEYGGDLYMIDTRNYVENNQGAVAGNSGTAASKATTNNVRLINAPSIGGRFVAAAPLWDGTDRLLASWTQCRVIDPATSAVVNCTSARLSDPAFVSAPPVYSVWMFNPADGTQQPVVPPAEGVMISDVVVAQPRTAPTFRPVNLNSNLAVNQTLKGENVGVLDIRSVYDFDGIVSGGITSISEVADPNNTAYTARQARFLRVEKAVSQPDEGVRDVNNNAFGATNFMREIVGYIPIEPDGSVVSKVPANVAFQISVIDANGRRISNFPRHNAWLTVRPGETMQCNGCHTNTINATPGESGRSHGRSGVFNSIYAGATATIFANTNTTFTANTGQTMAQARSAWSCLTEQCAASTPGMNLVFANVWPSGTTDSKVTPTIPPRAGDFALLYAGMNGLTTRAPTSGTCVLAWSSVCRITINYLEHIQPLWERTALVDVDGSGTIDDADKCIGCHNRTGANGTQAPAGDLELTQDSADEVGNENALRVKSYQELLFTHRRHVLNGTTLEDICTQFVTDPVTNVTTCAQFATVPPSLLARNALGSRFFSVFSAGSGSHANYLTSGELRLISEWVDIGAQYYNDPFKAPEN